MESGCPLQTGECSETLSPPTQVVRRFFHQPSGWEVVSHVLNLAHAIVSGLTFKIL